MEATHSRAGVERRAATQVVADGVVIVGDVDGPRWKREGFQPIVCRECGIEGCQPGGWVAARQAGDWLLWVPAFGLMDDDLGAREHAPPELLVKRGVLAFDEASAASLRALVDQPGLRAPAALTSRELVELVQWLAPLDVLGCFPAPASARVGHVLAVSSGDRAERLEQLAERLRDASDDPCALRPRCAQDEIVTFFLDGPSRTIEWSPFVVVDGKPALQIDDLVTITSSA